MRGGGSISGVFQPTVERLVRKSYGKDYTLADVLSEIREVEREAYVKRQQAEDEYRIKQRSMIFLYIKEIWDLLRGHVGQLNQPPTPGANANTNTDADITRDYDYRQELDDIRTTRLSGLDKHGFLPSDTMLLEHVPYLCAVAAYIPSVELEHTWFFKDTYPFLHNDPTVKRKPLRTRHSTIWHRYNNHHHHHNNNNNNNNNNNSNSNSGHPHNMRWDMRVNQNPAWYVEAAWRMLVDTAGEYLNTTITGCLPFGHGTLQHCFVSALKKELLAKEGAASCAATTALVATDPDPELLWIRLACIWWRGEYFPQWHWEPEVPEDVRRELVTLGKDLKARVSTCWPRLGIQLHHLGTRPAPPLPPSPPPPPPPPSSVFGPRLSLFSPLPQFQNRIFTPFNTS